MEPAVSRGLCTPFWPIGVQMVPSLLAALSRTRVVSRLLAATRLAVLLRPVLSYSRRFKRVIVTPAVYPRLVEFLHFDIQSTGQKSHCVSIR